jgi:Ca-activated chloride channel family protein
MELFFSQFHLLRPAWLFALIPAIILFSFLLKRRLASARWNGIIDKTLMPHVLDQMPSEQSRWPLWFILFAWVIASIALAGPTWQQLPQPVQKKNDALVIVLDMSLSMAAQDVSPDRATRAQQKVIDILKQRTEGLTALVVYAGDAYTVTPLTDDTETAINLVPALSPFIMPAMGSRPDKALILAKKLIKDAGLSRANYLLVTDGIQEKDINRIKKALGNQQQQLSVLTLGTEEGAPIAMQGQGFKRDNNGNIVLPKLDLNLIKSLASELGIRWHQMSFDDRDWHYLLGIDSAFNNLDSNNTNDANNIDINNKALERQFDLWADQGYWLIFIIVIIAAFSFRRGWMLSLVFMISMQPETSYADLWDDAWQTKDQQGKKVFTQDPAKAAELFEDPNWKASSYYRAEEYEKAAETFPIDQNISSKEQAENIFNRANALAKGGKLEESIKAYEQALELNTEFDDAQFNKNLVEKLLEQQEQEEQQQDKDDSEDQKDTDSKDDDAKDDESKNDDSKDQKSDDSESQNSDSDSKNDSEESDSEQSDSEKQDSEQSESDKNNDSEQQEEQESEANKEQSEDQQSDKQSAEEKEQQGKQQETNSAENPTDELSEEEKQALEQWLNRIPDDPGGLLKRKFLYQYKQRDQQDEGEVSW